MNYSADSVITHVNSDRIRRVRGLHQARARRKSGRFLVEGPQAVREAIRYRGDSIVELYLTERARLGHVDVWQHSELRMERLHLVSEEVMNHLSSDSQGILAVMTMKEDLTPMGSLLVAMVEVQDPGNAGTIIRVADAVGADGVIATKGTVEVTNPKVVRSTVGSLFHLPVVTGVDLAQVVEQAQAQGLQVLAADGRGDHLLEGTTLRAVPGVGAANRSKGERLPDLRKPTLWLLGNEARGFSSDQLALADASVALPIYGQAESLNVATAATVCLYASAWAQRVGTQQIGTVVAPGY